MKGLAGSGDRDGLYLQAYGTEVKLPADAALSGALRPSDVHLKKSAIIPTSASCLVYSGVDPVTISQSCSTFLKTDSLVHTHRSQAPITWALLDTRQYSSLTEL